MRINVTVEVYGISKRTEPFTRKTPKEAADAVRCFFTTVHHRIYRQNRDRFDHVFEGLEKGRTSMVMGGTKTFVHFEVTE